MAQKKKSDVTRMKGSIGEPARSELSPCSLVAGLGTKLIIMASTFSITSPTDVFFVRCCAQVTNNTKLHASMTIQPARDTRTYLTFNRALLGVISHCLELRIC
jgi:hypothetical protein